MTDEEDPPKIAGVSSARFREVMGHFGSGVTIVTGTDSDDPVGFTCQSFMSLSLDPPLIAIAPGKSSTSWPRIAPSGIFCVNMLSEKQEALCRDFAVSGSEKGDKFRGVGWKPGPDQVPVLDDALAFVVCRILQMHDAGDHEIIVGEVIDTGVDTKGRPLLFYRGGFGRFES
jgi:flavin reductase (DIM6/NTAB) family NADH-FMN oxidoreductase RutF